VYKKLLCRWFVRRRLEVMFERFTARTRKVMVLAQQEAERLRPTYIGTEHPLLGLLRKEEGVAARALTELGVTVEEACERVESTMGYGTERSGMQAPFTPRSKKALELALREAVELGHTYIGTEHLLLGVVGKNGGVGARVLSDLGVSPDAARREVVWRLGGHDDEFRRELVRSEADSLETTRSQLLFRGRVDSLRVDVRLADRPERLLLDLDYAYAVVDTENASRALPYDGLLTNAAGGLEAGEFGSVEAAIWEAGGARWRTFPPSGRLRSA
jgi:hypothetical protein